MYLSVRFVGRICLAVLCSLPGTFAALGDDDVPAISSDNSEAEVWLQGLNDSNYRVRRESFLKLCDRTVPIDEWLARESKSPDKHRSAVSLWLIRMRKSSGTLAERAEILQDYEALLLEDESVLLRYVMRGRWAQLIELLSLVEPNRRIEFLNQNNRIEVIVASAWRTENEEYVPRLLDLCLPPTRRIYANRWWRTMGMPEQWQVNEESNLPSVKIFQLEAEGKLDEAIALAKRSMMANYVERLLIRAFEWDKWLALGKTDKRVPLLGDNVVHQRASLLMQLGRLDAANDEIDQARKQPIKTIMTHSDGFLALALDRTDEFEQYLNNLSGSEAFSVLNTLGDSKGALAKAGITDLSVQGVTKWLDERGFDDAFEADLKSDENEGSGETKDVWMLRCADTFFQLGYHEQATLIEDHIIKDVLKAEADGGSAVWRPVFKHWVENIGREMQRSKAILAWNEILTREGIRGRKPTSTLMQKLNQDSTNDEDSIFSILYSEFPISAPKIYDYLYALEIGEQAEDSTLQQREQAIEKALQIMEDLNAGRMPEGWKESQGLEKLKNEIMSPKLSKESQIDVIGMELAKVFDALGETQLAFECVSALPRDESVIRAEANYLAKLGQLKSACALQEMAFEEHSNDLQMLIDLTDNLERLGRFSELERYRVQGLSSVAPMWRDLIEIGRRAQLPVRPEVQMVMEQLWIRDENWTALQLLNLQLRDAAKKDIKLVSKAAEYNRIQSLYLVKLRWPTIDFRLHAIQFTRGMNIFVLDAIAKKDQQLADTMMRLAHRCNPQDIDLPIDILSLAEKTFGKETADAWFSLYYDPMLKHLEEFPDDTLVGNNTAWLAASCNRNLEVAHRLASKVVASAPTATYLDTLAEIEYRLGNVDKAIELSERCLKIEPLDKHHREQLQRFRARNP